MLPDVAPIENVWQLLKMKLTKINFYKLSIFDLRNKLGMEVFGSGFSYYTCVRSMNDRISQVIKSGGDFI